MMGSHIIDGKFQSDKYPTCPPNKVPLSVKDKTAQDLLWTYAQRRRAVDEEFSSDLEEVLLSIGYLPPVPTREDDAYEAGRISAMNVIVRHADLGDGVRDQIDLVRAEVAQMHHTARAFARAADNEKYMRIELQKERERVTTMFVLSDLARLFPKCTYCKTDTIFPYVCCASCADERGP